MNKSLVVIFHVEDQAVWIEDIRMYPYTRAGIIKALNDKEDAFNWDYVHDCTYILDEDEALKLFNFLINARRPHVVYDYMRSNKNSSELEDIRI